MITSELFGTAPCGTSVHRYTLNGPEICVRIMDYGATVLGIDVPDIPGNVRDVVLGFDRLEDYSLLFLYYFVLPTETASCNQDAIDKSLFSPVP